MPSMFQTYFPQFVILLFTEPTTIRSRIDKADLPTLIDINTRWGSLMRESVDNKEAQLGDEIAIRMRAFRQEIQDEIDSRQ